MSFVSSLTYFLSCRFCVCKKAITAFRSSSVKLLPNEGMMVLYCLNNFCAVVSPASMAFFGSLMKFLIHSTELSFVTPANFGPIPSRYGLWQAVHWLPKIVCPFAIVTESPEISKWLDAESEWQLLKKTSNTKVAAEKINALLHIIDYDLKIKFTAVIYRFFDTK